MARPHSGAGQTPDDLPPPVMKRASSAGGKPPAFPTLELEVLATDKACAAVPNSWAGLPIHNEFFEGQCLLLLRREPLDEAYTPIFEGKNRMFEVQVQGRFLKVPEGDLYIGVEITDRMKLGLVTKGLCKVLLGFSQKINRYLHYSFGVADNSELPHICFPLITSVDNLVMTPPGETPPQLGQPLQEDKAEKDKRMGTAGFGTFEQGNVYTFSFHSMYLDIPRWSSCKIPIMRDMDLHTFWGDSALRLVAYMVPSEVGTKPHMQKQCRYLLNLQVRHVADAGRQLWQEGSEDGTEDDSTDAEGSAHGPEEGTAPQREEASEELVDVATPPRAVRSRGSQDGPEKSEPVSAHPPQRRPSPEYPLIDDRLTALSSDLRWEEAKTQEFGQDEEGDDDTIAGFESDVTAGSDDMQAEGSVYFDAQDTQSLATPSPHPLEHNSPKPEAGGHWQAPSDDTSEGHSNGAIEKQAPTQGPQPARCPAYFELGEKPHAGGGGNKKNLVYAVVHRGVLRFRQAKHFARMLPAQTVSEQEGPTSDLLSSKERHRRAFNSALAALSQDPSPTAQSQLEAFMSAQTHADRAFRSDARDANMGLSGDGEGRAHRLGSKASGLARRASFNTLYTSRPAAGGVLHEGLVVRALSEHHLSQEWAAVTGGALLLYCRKKQSLRIDFTDLLRVGRSDDLEGQGCMLPGYHTIELHTLGMVHYLLVEGAVSAQQWADALAEALRAHSPQPDQELNLAVDMESLNLADPHENFLTKKSCWSGRSRWILNCRRLHFSHEEPDDSPHPCDVVSELLRQALALRDDGGPSRPPQLIEFLDATTSLRWLKLDPLSHTERLALFLNLYHLMILHAYFILGPPGSPLRWTSYFTTLCYECGGSVFSVAELEHCVIRSSMSPPKQFLSRFMIPTSQYSFSLQKPEPRINMALNCGSVSGVPGITIYERKSVDQQLDLMCMYFLHETVKVVAQKRVVVLPKILQWYSGDFGKGTPLDCLKGVTRFLAGDVFAQVQEILKSSASSPPTVKFHHFDWRCRKIDLVDQAYLQQLCSSDL